jgi:galactokinase
MEQLKNTFQQLFGDLDEVYSFFAPGRVNLIGEHTDYNGGHVFPCALDIGTYCLARKRTDKKVKMFSLNFKEIGVVEFDLGDIHYNAKHNWANYPKGIIHILQKEGYQIDQGFEVVFQGNIPNGAGLSSSASIELATAVMLKELYHLHINQLDLVRFSQKAENEFIGVNCGIMDQFSIGFGKLNHAILLNCKTLQYTYSPIELKDVSLVIANTNKKRGLTDSKYNERRSECEQALKILQKVHTIDFLCDLTVEEWEESKHLVQHPVYQKRANHIIYENERTVLASELLKKGDIHAFGKLMNESHISLRDDYEVTGKELDTLVEAAWEEGAIGARMTGAGFGGCTVNLVETVKLELFMQNVEAKYKKKIGLTPEFYPVRIGDGARLLLP